MAEPRADLAAFDARMGRYGAGFLLAVCVLSAASGYVERTFDAYVHMFFADHYLRGWFELWEPRWYGGFSVASYPPLAHQTVALFTPLLGHERAFVAVTSTVLIALGVTTALASERFLQRRSFGWALFLAALWPTAYRFAFVYGQLPTLFAAPLVLLGVYALDGFLDDGRKLQLALFVCCIGAVAGTHHISVVFAALGCAIISVKQLVASSQRAVTARRVLLAGALATVAMVSVVWPFLKYAAAAPQTEIPHITRDPLWRRPFDASVVEQVFMFALAAVCAVRAALRRDVAYCVLAAGTLLFTVLSMGATTPLPELMFRSQWRWLTYDKFHLWAATFSVMLAVWWARRPSARFAAAVAIIAIPLCTLSVSHKASDSLQPAFVRDIDPILALLNQPGAERYRHLALGFGDQFCRFDIFGKSPNIDGDYHTARSLELLRTSGMGTVDAAKYYPAGPRVLRSLLANADAHALRWVLVNDDWYYSFLFEAGFELRDVLRNGVTVFEKSVAPIQTAARAPESRAAALVWGLLPMGFLAFTLCLVFAVALQHKAERGPRERDEDEQQADHP